MFDALVIGGGILGMLSALELHRAGRKVCVVDKGTCGQEASWAGGGIVSPLHPWRYAPIISELARWSQAQYPALCAELNETTGINPEFTRNGLLVLGAEEYAPAQSWAKRYGACLEVLDAAGTAAREPQLGERADAALWLPDIAQVRNPRLVKALRLMLVQRGVELREQCAVKTLLFENGVTVGADTVDGPIRAAQVLLCAGAWSRALLRDDAFLPAIKPIRGQMLVFQAPAALVSRIVLADTHYVIPRRDGRTLVGSTLEDAGFDKSTTVRAKETLYQEAARLIPALSAYPVEKHWAGLRPASPGGIPYIGAHPDYPGLYLNSGHFRNGVVLGPASARLAVDIMLQRPPMLDPAACLPNAARDENESHGCAEAPLSV